LIKEKTEKRVPEVTAVLHENKKMEDYQVFLIRICFRNISIFI
jgi:hypothetical protein